MSSSAPVLLGASPDKREAILAAALRLLARSGLHNTPMSALAREAGVAAGTLYLYFPSKEALINALYLELLRDQDRATAEYIERPTEPRADTTSQLWPAWHAMARWHLDNPEASNVIHQCRASAILTAETRETEQRAQAVGLARFDQAIAVGFIRDLPVQVFYALFAGPIFILARMRETGEIEVTDEVLRATFDGVCRAVLP